MDSSPSLCEGTSCAACPKIAAIDEKITTTRLLLEALLAERRVLKSQQNQNHDPYILRLPTELSSRIFTYCLQLRQAESLKGQLPGRFGWRWYDDKHSRGSRPSEIAMVCCGWRDIALSTPQLWTHIHVTLNADDRPAYLGFMNDLVCRSGSLPLSFSIKGRGDTESCERFKQDDYLPLINLLNLHSARWHIVHIDMDPNRIPLLVGSGAPSNLLSALFIGCPDGNVAPGSFPFQLKGGPPSPLHVESTGFGFKSLRLDWSRATEVTLSDSSIFLEDFFMFLSAAPQLEILDIEITVLDSEDGTVTNVEQSRGPITCPNLWSLEMRLERVADMLPFIDLFGNLVFPRLSSLRLWHFDDIVGLADFVSRSSCDLPILHLLFLEDEHPRTFNELAQMPSLKELELESCGIDIEALLKRLAETRVVGISPTSVQTFLPKLEYLYFIGPTPQEVMNWSLIPSIFPPTGEQPPGNEIRPFKNFVFALTATLSDFDDPNDYYIPKEDIAALEKIVDRGFLLNIRNDYDRNDKGDFIALSRQFHNGRL